MGESKNMNEYYKEMLGKGLHFQDFVVEELYKIGLPIISYSSKEYQTMIGENKAGLEIKLDNNYKKTGNLYIEIAEKTKAANPDYIPSGIYRSDNTWLYLIGNYEEIYIYAKKFLIQLHKCGKYREIEITRGTSMGYLLPKKDAIKYCARIIVPAGKA